MELYELIYHQIMVHDTFFTNDFINAIIEIGELPEEYRLEMASTYKFLCGSYS
jgi:hypothetical protein